MDETSFRETERTPDLLAHIICDGLSLADLGRDILEFVSSAPEKEFAIAQKVVVVIKKRSAKEA